MARAALIGSWFRTIALIQRVRPRGLPRGAENACLLARRSAAGADASAAPIGSILIASSDYTMTRLLKRTLAVRRVFDFELLVGVI